MSTYLQQSSFVRGEYNPPRTADISAIPAPPPPQSTWGSNVLSWNFVLQQLCEKNLYGNQIPRRGFTAASGERCVPPFSAIDYRRYAAECVRLAQSTSEPVDKARLLDMAETFSELADKSETWDRGNPGR
jgi:hypothetical protein